MKYYVIYYKINRFQDPIKIVRTEDEALRVCAPTKGFPITEKSYKEVILK